jgi:hypothetical protein
VLGIAVTQKFRERLEHWVVAPLVNYAQQGTKRQIRFTHAATDNAAIHHECSFSRRREKNHFWITHGGGIPWGGQTRIWFDPAKRPRR